MISSDFSRKLELGSISFYFRGNLIGILMAKEAFEQRLQEFFETYDERKLNLVPKIAKKLHRHEELIMNHLHKKYQTGKARNVSEEELREEDRIRREKESGVSEEQEKASEEEESSEQEDTSGEEASEEKGGEAEKEEDEEKKE